MIQQRKTKVVCTIGPVSEKKEMMRKLIIKRTMSPIPLLKQPINQIQNHEFKSNSTLNQSVCLR